MSGKLGGGPAGVIVGVLVLGSIATIALISNFGDYGLGFTWPVLMVAAGFSMALFGFFELGFGLVGCFIIWLLANLGVIPEFSRSWPFILIWIVAMVVIGYYRARNSSGS